jgi:hypothetical protein
MSREGLDDSPVTSADIDTRPISEALDVLDSCVDQNQVSNLVDGDIMERDAPISNYKSHSVDNPEDDMTEAESPLSKCQSHSMDHMADDMTQVTEPVSELTEAASVTSQAWKFKSQFLEMELEGDEALKLAQELHLALKATLKGPEPPKISPTSRLLEPTEAFRKSGYNKPPPVRVDPREQGWVAVKTKQSTAINSIPPTSPETNDIGKINVKVDTD